MFKNIFVKIYPKNPHPGNVINQVKIIFLAIFQFTLENLFEAPTPITAKLLLCVVLTGIPNTVEPNKQIELEISAAAAWYFSSFTTFVPIVFIILTPPIIAPKVTITEQYRTSQIGIVVLLNVVIQFFGNVASNKDCSGIV